MRSQTRRSAFTLLEVMLVMGILALLATVAVVGYSRLQDSMDKKAAKVQVDDTARAIDIYRTAMRTVPTTEEGLAALCRAPDDEKLGQMWRDGGGPFLKDGKIPTDPWGTELKYEKVESGLGDATGPEYHVYSCGPDRQPSTADDIKSWDEETN